MAIYDQEAAKLMYRKIKDASPEATDAQIMSYLQSRGFALPPEFQDALPAPTPSAPPDPATAPVHAKFFDGLVKSVQEAGTGFAKNAASTIAGASALGENLMRAPLKAVGMQFPQQPLGTQVQNSGQLDLNTTAEKVGGAVERVGEAVAAGAATGNPFSLGSTAGEFAAGAAGRAGLAAGTMGTLEAMHQGDINKEVGKSALTAAAFSVAFSAAESLLKNVAKGAWSTLLKRTPSEAAKNPDLSAQAADMGIVGTSRESILAKVEKNIQQIEVSLSEKLTNAEGTVDGKTVAGYLDPLKKLYASIPGYTDLADNVAALQDEYAAKGALSAVDANGLKRSIYQLIEKSYGKGLLNVNVDVAAQKAAASGLKREIEKIAPEVKDLNARESILIGMKDALERTIGRMEGKGIWGTHIGLLDLGLGGIGAVVGSVAGSAPLGVGIATAKIIGEQPLVLSGIAKLAGYFNTLSPTQKMMFANAISGLVNDLRTKKKK